MHRLLFPVTGKKRALHKQRSFLFYSSPYFSIRLS